MTIIRQYKGENTWHEVPHSEAMKTLEMAYEKDFVKSALEEGIKLQTPFAFYKKQF
jgi:hypothetical protein